jgi:hypothetical protein
MDDPYHVWAVVHSLPNESEYKAPPYVEKYGVNHIQPETYQTRKLKTLRINLT